MNPENALDALSDALRAENSVVSAEVVAPAPGTEPALGLVAAAGPRAADAPAEYALIVESVREGYLLHYGEPRIVNGDDRDLALLAGDYLYALGLERLAARADLEAIAELCELIAMAAQVHDGARVSDRVAAESAALWLAAAAAIGAGTSPAHDEAKSALRAGDPGAAERLWEAAQAIAEKGGFGVALRVAAQAIDFAADSPSSRG